MVIPTKYSTTKALFRNKHARDLSFLAIQKVTASKSKSTRLWWVSNYMVPQDPTQLGPQLAITRQETKERNALYINHLESFFLTPNFNNTLH
jgi:hypothetical protein